MYDLSVLGRSVDRLEEQHNEILDVLSEVDERRVVVLSEAHQRVAAIRADCESLREGIHARLQKAKRAAVILSLLGQDEELSAVRSRVDKQPYERYVDAAWLRRNL